MQYAALNSYFSAFIYLSKKSYIRFKSSCGNFIQNQIDLSDVVDPEMAIAKQGLAEVLKYSLIVVATAQILCIYPFIQIFYQGNNDRFVERLSHPTGDIIYNAGFFK